ncbi:MAG: DUF4139 domain-containing protein [Methanothrix soehngenii]|jgi:hypothetical protein|nr:DUF4139 domain-containing protein [Methanothrix soehngenii]
MGFVMKFFAVFLMMLLCAPALASTESSGVEATTAVTLPVDSVTVYPDGLMAVKRMGTLDTTVGEHKFVINIPDAADKSSILLSVSNASVQRVVYDSNPVYALNISSSGPQDFALSYLMHSAGFWEPRYDLHLANDSVLLNANAVVRNRGGEDLKNVRLKLVAGLPLAVEPIYRSAQIQQAYAAEAALNEAFDLAAAPEGSSSGELETLYIFELEGRKDLAQDKEIGFPLFQENVPLVRVYTWNAYLQEEGPAVEEIRANNTMKNPWPSGTALLYRNDDYVSTIDMPYTASGTNATLVIGPSADLKVTRKLKDYNVTEKIRAITSSGRNHTVKETTETWTYHLKVESNLDRAATLEATDNLPQEAEMIDVTPKPAETTATSLKWRLQLLARQKTAIDYSYRVVTTESLDGSS